MVEIYRLLIKFWNQSSNIEKVLYYSIELARVELTRTNYYESKIILENILQLLEQEGEYLNLPSFFEPQIYDLLSGFIFPKKILLKINSPRICLSNASK